MPKKVTKTKKVKKTTKPKRGKKASLGAARRRIDSTPEIYTESSEGKSWNPPGSKKLTPRPGRRGLDIERPVPEYEAGDEFINRDPRNPWDGGVDSALIQPRRGARAPMEDKVTPPIGRRCILQHADSKVFDPKSFRYKVLEDDDQGRVLLMGCPLGKWDPSLGKGKECIGGMKTHITMVPRDQRDDTCPDGLEPD